MTEPTCLDQNGDDAYHDDWLWGCKYPDAVASNGQRVTSALALRIAADVLRQFDPSLPDTPSSPAYHTWTPKDLSLARAAIAGIRAQQGVVSADSKALMNDDDGWHATRELDVWIYG